MPRLLRLVPVLVLLAGAAAAQPYPLGPFSRLAKYPEGAVSNGFFSVLIERGFKLQAVVPELTDGSFGRTEYAGFLTLDTGGGPLFERFKQPGDGTVTAACDSEHLVVAKDSDGYRQELTLWQGHPFAWLKASTPRGEGPVTWLLTGYEWAGKKPPSRCWLWLDGEKGYREVALGEPGSPVVPEGRKLGGELVLLPDSSGKFALALVFGQQQVSLTVRADGLAITVPEGPLPSFAVGILPPEMPVQAASDLAMLAFIRPVSRASAFRLENGQPVVEFTSKQEVLPSWGMPQPAFIPLPPSLADRAPAGARKLPSLWGTVALCSGDTLKLALPPVPRLREVMPPAAPLGPKGQKRIGPLTDELLARLRPAGGFRFSDGRPFYDGLTCSGLMAAYPSLDPERQKKTAEAVRRTLDLWWNGLRLDGETGIWNFPEPVPAVPVVDYPEITATLLWPTVQYATLVEAEYAKTLAPKLAKLGPSLARAYDCSGAAYAYPGPEFTHVITESVIGGFVAWCGMYQLATLAGQTEAAGEYAARAALAAEAMKLLRRDPRYGERAVVSELRPESLKVAPTIPWDYTMYTWFTYVPAFQLPREDLYGVWAALERDKWWTYTEQSTQRCYDYADVMALARTFAPATAKEKLALLDDRPFTYDHFDGTPVYALMAYAWLGSEW